MNHGNRARPGVIPINSDVAPTSGIAREGWWDMALSAFLDWVTPDDSVGLIFRIWIVGMVGMYALLVVTQPYTTPPRTGHGQVTAITKTDHGQGAIIRIGRQTVLDPMRRRSGWFSPPTLAIPLSGIHVGSVVVYQQQHAQWLFGWHAQRRLVSLTVQHSR